MIGSTSSRGKPQDRIVVFVNGLGIEDLAAAVEIFRLAGEKQAGTMLDPEWS